MHSNAFDRRDEGRRHARETNKPRAGRARPRSPCSAFGSRMSSTLSVRTNSGRLVAGAASDEEARRAAAWPLATLTRLQTEEDKPSTPKMSLQQALTRLSCGYDAYTVFLVAGYCVTSSLLSILNKFAVLHFPYPAALTGFQYGLSALTVMVLCVHGLSWAVREATRRLAPDHPFPPALCCASARAGSRSDSSSYTL